MTCTTPETAMTGAGRGAFGRGRRILRVLTRWLAGIGRAAGCSTRSPALPDTLRADVGLPPREPRKNPWDYL